jgi:hypothetical protein
MHKPDLKGGSEISTLYRPLVRHLPPYPVLPKCRQRTKYQKAQTTRCEDDGGCRGLPFWPRRPTREAVVFSPRNGEGTGENCPILAQRSENDLTTSVYEAKREKGNKGTHSSVKREQAEETKRSIKRNEGRKRYSPTRGGEGSEVGTQDAETRTEGKEEAEESGTGVAGSGRGSSRRIKGTAWRAGRRMEEGEGGPEERTCEAQDP